MTIQAGYGGIPYALVLVPDLDVGLRCGCIKLSQGHKAPHENFTARADADEDTARSARRVKIYHATARHLGFSTFYAIELPRAAFLPLGLSPPFEKLH